MSKVKIADIATLGNGINFGKSAYAPGVKLIGVSDFKDRMYPDFDTLQEVDSKVVKRGDYLSKGDIVFVRSNGNKELVGRCMMVNKDIPVTFSGFCIKLHLNDTDKYDPVYFTYLFKDRTFRQVMSGTAVGANIQNLSQARLGSFEANVPSITTQHRISSILSRYDSLIDNYKKQINLLEETALRLYKEWFVDFHFPGYENAIFEEGIPTQWKKKKLYELAIESGKRLKKEERNEYNIYLPIDSLPKKQLTYLVGEPVDNAESSLLSFDVGDIIFGAMRPYFHKVCIAQEKGITRSTCFVLNSILPEYHGYLSMFMFDVNTIKHATNISVGTTMPYVRWNDLKQMELLIPDKKTAAAFNSFFKTIMCKARNYAQQIQLLTEARDRLLPKLMNGEIKV